MEDGLEGKEKALFHLLVERTRVLAIVCDNAIEVLSEDFQDMVEGPLRTVQEVLKDCPFYSTVWDGSFSDDDIVVESFRHETQQQESRDRGVRVRHLPTDLAVEAYQKPTPEENEKLARKVLAEMVQERWEASNPPAEPRTGRKPRN
jgi:hypothetical protein